MYTTVHNRSLNKQDVSFISKHHALKIRIHIQKCSPRVTHGSVLCPDNRLLFQHSHNKYAVGEVQNFLIFDQGVYKQ